MIRSGCGDFKIWRQILCHFSYWKGGSTSPPHKPEKVVAALTNGVQTCQARSVTCQCSFYLILWGCSLWK